MSERLPVHASRSSGAGSTVMPNVAAEWLLTAGERGNLATASTPHESGLALTVGNLVRVHVDGAAYFARLHELLFALGPGACAVGPPRRGDPRAAVALPSGADPVRSGR